MIGTDNHYKPLYPEKRPLIADLIVDQDIEGLERYYGKKQVQKSSVIEGAYEATDLFEDLGGKPRYLYFLAAPVYDDSGEVIAAIETLQDVTRERELARYLRENAETLRRELDENIRLRKTIEGIIEGSPIPTFVIDKDHRVILWNRAFTEMSGYPGEKMIGTKKQWMPFYPEKRPVIADLIVDGDTQGLEAFYGKKKVQKSSVIEGAYEAPEPSPLFPGRPDPQREGRDHRGRGNPPGRDTRARDGAQPEGIRRDDEERARREHFSPTEHGGALQLPSVRARRLAGFDPGPGCRRDLALHEPRHRPGAGAHGRKTEGQAFLGIRRPGAKGIPGGALG
jgi:PAS domain-containing protein